MTDDTAYGNREIADLLPWYESGRLDIADRLRVEAALATDPALRQELTLVREEMAETIVFNESLGAPSRQASERFFAALDASPRGRARFNLVRFVADHLQAMRPQALAFGAMVALAIVVLQAGVISHLMSKGRGGATYQSASVQPQATQIGPVLLVAFAPTAKAGAIQKLLEDNSLIIVAGPAAGYFSLAVEGREMPPSEVSNLMTRLSKHKDVIQTVMLQSPPD